MRKAALHNLGCKVNSYETEAMQQLLEEAGYEIVPFAEGADVYIINTCSVTNIADRKSRQMLHRAKKMNPQAVVVAAGCYVQSAGEALKLDEAVDLVIGNNKKTELVRILDDYFTSEDHTVEETVIDIGAAKDYEALTIKRIADHTRAFIKVTDGCNQFCSYCIIPYTRGRVRSRKLEDVRAEILAAVDRGMKVNLYLEDWSNGMRRSPDYVYAMLDGLADAPVSRFMCPDTLGVLDPYDTERFCRDLVERYPSLHFDFHAHNDYDLAVANTAAAVRAGFHGVHVTVNGLGERAGNAPLSSAVAVLHDRLGRTTGIDETKINRVSRTVESYTGIRIPANRPIVGASVFTQCAGIHADGDSKNNLYFNELLPERFGRVREYALGKTSGKANIMKNLETLGIDLDEASMRKVTERVVELSDKKELVTAEDLPYIIADVLRYDLAENPVRILNYSLSLAQGLHPAASLKIEINGREYEQTSAGDGQYDAFMRALRQIYEHQLRREFPMLRNYTVSIPPGGRTDAFVQTIITWEMGGKVFKTRGLDADQTEAAIKATIKMLNIIETNYNDHEC